jgi:hypothetical protein
MSTWLALEVITLETGGKDWGMVIEEEMTPPGNFARAF